MRITKTRDIFANDGITVGVAPFGANGQGFQIASVSPWASGSNLNPKVVTINLDPQKVAKACAANNHWLDVYVQDDTVIDFMRLTVTHP